jgi:hypothetical protein
MQSFRQLYTVTHICAMDHSKFFLTFVEKMVSILDEYVHMPRTPKKLITEFPQPQ